MSSPPNYSHRRTASADDHQIRSRLLNRLGIYDAPATIKTQQRPMTAAQLRRVRILRGMGVGYTLHPSPPDGSATRPPLDNVQRFQEPLKKVESKKDFSSSPSTSSSSSASSGTSTGSSGIVSLPDKPRRIAFQEDVEVVPIPTRYEYSDRIKSRIWSNRHELQENAERNALEFAAEGWNWRTVTEDDGMFICSVSGELVHPIHLQHLMQEEARPPSPAPHRLERGAPVH